MNEVTEEVNGSENTAEQTDDALLLICGNLESRQKTTEYVKKVASAIYSCVQKHKVARLRCVGAAALNNAIKASAIARGEFAKKGVDIAVMPSFKEVNFGSDKKTAMLLEVITFED